MAHVVHMSSTLREHYVPKYWKDSYSSDFCTSLVFFHLNPVHNALTDLFAMKDHSLLWQWCMTRPEMGPEISEPHVMHYNSTLNGSDANVKYCNAHFVPLFISDCNRELCHATELSLHYTARQFTTIILNDTSGVATGHLRNASGTLHHCIHWRRLCTHGVGQARTDFPSSA